MQAIDKTEATFTIYIYPNHKFTVSKTTLITNSHVFHDCFEIADADQPQFVEIHTNDVASFETWLMIIHDDSSDRETSIYTNFFDKVPTFYDLIRLMSIVDEYQDEGTLRILKQLSLMCEIPHAQLLTLANTFWFEREYIDSVISRMSYADLASVWRWPHEELIAIGPRCVAALLQTDPMRHSINAQLKQPLEPEFVWGDNDVPPSPSCPPRDDSSEEWEESVDDAEPVRAVAGLERSDFEVAQQDRRRRRNRGSRGRRSNHNNLRHSGNHNRNRNHNNENHHRNRPRQGGPRQVPNYQGAHGRLVNSFTNTYYEYISSLANMG